MFSCTDDGSEVDGGDEKNKGGIVLSAQLEADDNVDAAAEVDLAGYTLTVDGPTKVNCACPGDGVIKELAAGSGYSVLLTDMPAEYAPAFDDPRYTGKKESVEVSAGANTPVQITLSRVNAGVFFEYDESLAAKGLTDLKPTVTMSGKSLAYGQGEPAKKGYFAPGAFTVTLKNGDEDIEIGGQPSRSLTAAGKDMWRIRLYAGENGKGPAVVNAEVTELGNPDNITEWKGEGVVPGGGSFSIAGYEDADIVLTYSDGTTENQAVDAAGTFTPEQTDKIIRSVKKEGGPEILIGRKADEQITIKTDGTNLVLREDGTTCLAGTYGELMLIEYDLSRAWKQDADIDLMDMLFTPLAKTGPFTGEFDGNGYVIRNLRIDMVELKVEDPETPLEKTGFFRWVNGTVENLVIESGSVKTDTEAAGLVGNLMGGLLKNCTNGADVTAAKGAAAGIAAMAYGNSTIDGCVNKGSITAIGQGAGGITAVTVTMGVDDKRTNIKNCTNEGLIEVVYINGNYNSGQLAGGICGNITAGTIEGCTNKGTVRGQGIVGGIVGYTILDMSRMRNEGNIEGQTGLAAGIAAQHQGEAVYRDIRNSGKVTNGPESAATGGIIGSNSYCKCYDMVNTGEIIGGSNTGGIMGGSIGADNVLDNCYNTGSISGGNNVGGLYGDSGGIRHIVSNCYNTGAITGSGNQIGGLIGHQNGLTMQACYSTGNVSGKMYVGSLTGYLENAYTRGCYGKGNVTGTNYVGGIAGWIRHYQGKLLLYGSYYTGTVTGDNNTGGIAGNLNGGVQDCYWSGNQTVEYGTKGSNGAVTDCFYFDDGTPSGEAVTGWPADDATKHWGVGAPGTGEGYWWKGLGTRGSASYPTLHWQ